jgi:hypothetical protein
VVGPPGLCGCGCALSPQTSKGFSAVDFSRDVLGIEPLPWQRWLLIHALELLPDGSFRFRVIVVLVARQNGKTMVLQVKNLWKMFVLGVRLVIGTAQDLDTAEEAWDAAVEMVESKPELDAEKAHVDKTNGKKALKLTNGSRWKIVSTSRRGGRGKAGDDVNLDELREHLDWLAWGAITKTTMARRNAQIFGFSNAGDDRSIVLNDLQAKGHAAAAGAAGADPQLGLFEWSAPDDVKCTCARRSPDAPHAAHCRLRDRAAWAQANPALGYTITVQAIESALATDPEAVFRTEVLCQRVPDLTEGIITAGQWAKLHDPASKRAGDVALGADISPLRDYAAVAVYGLREDELGHGQLIDYRPGTEWLVGRLVELKDELDPVAIGMGRGTYQSLKEDLAEVGIEVPELCEVSKCADPLHPNEPHRGDLAVTTATSMAAACGQLIDAVRQGTLRVVPSDDLDASVTGARTRMSGDTIAWAPRDSKSDTAPVVAVTVGRWAYETRAHLVIDADYDVLMSIY